MFLLVLFFAPKKRTVGMWGYPPLTETGDYEKVTKNKAENPKGVSAGMNEVEFIRVTVSRGRDGR